MQGRQGEGKEAREWFLSHYYASVNGTGKQRPRPRRPPGMARVDQPPPTRRVARPQIEPRSPKSWRKRVFVLGGIVAVCGLLACGIGYAAVSFFNGISTAGGAATVSSDFLAALSSGNYDKAYNDLGAAITVQLMRDEFTQRAQNDDNCYGPVIDYTEKQGSATLQGNTQNYIYTISRKKLSHAYELKLTLQQDASGNWAITSYGNDLGPGQSACR